MSDLLQQILIFAVAVPAIVLHEVSHGYVAHLLGDPTAKERGRLSLNPIKHVDPFGTLLLPAMLALVGSPVVIGYAKPVPINPRYFRNYRMGMLLTGLAGPATNLVMAIVSGLVIRLLDATGASAFTAVGYAVLVLYFFALINLVLMFFNLIPIPPFDGSRIIPIFLSDRGLRAYAQIERYGFLIIFALLFLGKGLLSGYFELTVYPLLRLLTGV